MFNILKDKVSSKFGKIDMKYLLISVSILYAISLSFLISTNSYLKERDKVQDDVIETMKTELRIHDSIVNVISRRDSLTHLIIENQKKNSSRILAGQDSLRKVILKK